MSRLLFITSTRIGDAVLSTGILGHLIEMMHAPKVTVACGTAAAPLFAAVPGLSRVIPIEKRRHGLHWPLLWGKVALRRWDTVVDLRGSALAYLLWAGERIVWGGRADDALHRVEALGQLIGGDRPPPPRLWIGARQREAAARLIPHDGDPALSPVLAIGPTANWRGKQWRPGFFAELARRLTREDGILPGARIAVFAAGHEREQAMPVLETIPQARCIDLVGVVDPLEAFAALRRCAFYVGNDSGLMHLAAAADIPTLGLFGPSRERHYAPWGSKGVAARTQKGYQELVGHPDYDHRTTDTLMDSLTVSMVERAAVDLWVRTRGLAVAA